MTTASSTPTTAVGTPGTYGGGYYGVNIYADLTPIKVIARTTEIRLTKVRFPR